MNGNIELVNQFLKSAEDGNVETGMGILDQGLSINAQTAQGLSALHCAVKRTRYVFILFLIENGASLDIKTNDGLTPLHQAVLIKDTDIVELLLFKGACVDEKDINGKTALHYACDLASHAEIVTVLLENGADVKARDYTGKTPLHILISTGGRKRSAGPKLKIIDALIDLGADINAQDNHGCTPLHLALETIENEWVLRRLFEVGGSVEIFNNKNETPYDICLKKCKAGNFVWEETEHDSFNNRSVVINHILMLRVAKVPVSIDVSDRTDGDYEFEIRKGQLVKELERIEVYKVCDKLFLQTVFFAFKNSEFLKNDQLDDEVEKFLNSREIEKLFPYYGFMLQNAYKTSKKRSILVFKALEVLNAVLDEVCVVVCGKNLPDLITDKIVCHLSMKDLETLVGGKEDRVEIVKNIKLLNIFK